MSTLYLVATPIGNLEDISARALRILREAGLIAAEDTRHTRKLLSRFDIHTSLTSYHDHNKTLKLDHILATLEQQDVALVSDAGTPALNDPGYELVNAAIEAGHTVSPIPGPNAPIAALVTSGLPTGTFLYLGYLPRKTASRRKFLAGIATQPHTLVFLETPHRLLAALEDLREVLGDRQMAVARELTKLHEEIFRGPISAAHSHFSAAPRRGEFTLVVAGFTPGDERWPEDRLRSALVERLAEGVSPSQAARETAREAGWGRREVYSILVARQDEKEKSP
ncbi:MAG: 16S rRNA (cytidine(1402)-2'-O)-methyltransferase [Anaerolineales bacterium]